MVSSKAVNERNKAQDLLFAEHQENLMKLIQHEKEALFTEDLPHPS